MEQDAALYEHFMEAAGAIYAALADAQAHNPPPTPPPILQLRAGLAESPGWFLVQAAEFDPEPLTVERLRVRDTYASERIVAALLELMAGERWLERRGGESYHLTKHGRATLLARRTASAGLLAESMPLAAEQLGRLATLMQRLIDACLNSPNPPGTWCLAHSRRRAPANDAPPLARLMQLFDDINAFRDDAHMAAWRPLELSGYVWEAFTLVCAGSAHTGAQVAKQLTHRGYTPGEYASALAELVGLGWLCPAANGYAPTEMGSAARASAERLTNIYFYRPWRALPTNEVDELLALLGRLRDSAAVSK